MIVDKNIINGTKMSHKLILEEFKKRFTERFPNKQFDFSKSVYVDSHTLMDVICNNGHAFKMRPCDLMNGSGCPICSGNKKLTREEFIRDAAFVHNGYFTYNHSDDYTNVSSLVTVTCPVHGDFKVKANNHLNGANCKQCSKQGIKHKITKRLKKKKSTKKLLQEDFTARFNEMHSDKYFLTDKSNYKGYNQKVIISCKEHGEFQITPSHLFSGRGCPICGNNKQKSKEEVIKLITKAQPYSDFDYGELEYKGIHKSSLFKCNKCGCYFRNSPSNLIYHQNGCPSCSGSIMEKEIKHLLEENDIKYEFQKTFDWLVNKGHMYLDFYLEDYNIAIECQGLQHFEEVNFGNAKTLLVESKSRDVLKRELCEEHNIEVLYYANYNYNFHYSVFTDKEELLKKIKSAKKNN